MNLDSIQIGCFQVITKKNKKTFKKMLKLRKTKETIMNHKTNKKLWKHIMNAI